MICEDIIYSNKIELDAKRDNFPKLMEFIEQSLILISVDNSTINLIMTACEEVIINVIKYAYPDKEGKLKIEVVYKPPKISLKFCDHGIKFNPLEIPEVDTKLPLEERELGGLGILMVRKLMDKVEYEYDGKENHLTISKSTL